MAVAEFRVVDGRIDPSRVYLRRDGGVHTEHGSLSLERSRVTRKTLQCQHNRKERTIERKGKGKEKKRKRKKKGWADGLGAAIHNSTTLTALAGGGRKLVGDYLIRSDAIVMEGVHVHTGKT